jgi:hypothetical protein
MPNNAPSHELCGRRETAKICTRTDAPAATGNAQVIDLISDLARDRKALQLTPPVDGGRAMYAMQTNAGTTIGFTFAGTVVDGSRVRRNRPGHHADP